MKIHRLFAAGMAAMAITAQAVSADIRVRVDDTELCFGDAVPVIISERTFVPLRLIFEALGAYVDWDADTQTVFAHKRLTTVSMTVGETSYYVNGEENELDAPPVILNECTMIPVRAVAQALGAEVTWSPSEQTVLISSVNGDHVINDMHLDFWEKSEDGTVLMTGRIAYPEIESDEAVAQAFNEYTASAADEDYREFTQEWLAEADGYYESSKQNEFTFYPYMFERRFDIKYDKDGILSVIYVDSVYSGGAHPSTRQFAETYNMNTGKRLELTDILSSDLQKLRSHVRELFEAEINAHPELYYADALKCLDEALAEINWYMAEDGVHYFLNPYEIAPYAAGVIDISE